MIRNVAIEILNLIENNNQIAEVFSASTLRAIVSFINDNNIMFIIYILNILYITSIT